MTKGAQFLYIAGTYGRSAWESGLRIVGKPGKLSDGRHLDLAVDQLVVFGGFLLTLPVFFGAFLAFGFLGMLCKGERFRDQLQLWLEENRSER